MTLRQSLPALSTHDGGQSVSTKGMWNATANVKHWMKRLVRNIIIHVFDKQKILFFIQVTKVESSTSYENKIPCTRPINIYQISI